METHGFGRKTFHLETDAVSDKPVNDKHYTYLTLGYDSPVRPHIDFQILANIPFIGLSSKHRLNILEGSQKNIVSDNVSDVAKVQSWLPGSSIQQVL